MAQKFHVKFNESLRSPCTIPKLRSSLLENKTSAPSRNFLFCDQTKEFFGGLESDSNGSIHVGNCDAFTKQVIGLNVNTQELTGNLEHLKGTCNLSPSVKETKTVSDAALVHVKEKKFQSSLEHALPMGCDPQLLNSVNTLHQPTCHFCGSFGFLRCTQCKHVYYCSVDCQKKQWEEHSFECKPFKCNTDIAEDKEKSLDKIMTKANLLPMVNSSAQDEGKKIMFLELNTLRLKRNMIIEGTVTVFNNPYDFYVQINSPEVLNNINKLSVKLKDYDGVTQEEYIPSKGEVCVAKYSLDQTWHRVLIKDVDIIKKRAQVLYIDYGNGENTSLCRIKRLRKDIAIFPPCAVKCCVAYVTTAKKEWDANCSSAVAPLLMGKCCSLTIVDVLMDEMTTFAVDIVLPDCGKRLNDLLLKTGQNLKDMNNKENSDAGPTMEKSSTQEKTIEGRDVVHSGCLIPEINTVSVGDAFLGVVAHIQTPEYFFCQLLDNGRKLTELQTSLSEYCDKISAVPNFCPSVGDTCCAQFTEDNQWYRASVLSYATDKTVLVGYIDFGNFEALHLSRLRPIIPKLLELPMQAMKCTLAGVNPISGTWSTEATSLMKALVQNKVVTVTIVDKNENTFVVEITDASVTPTVNVHESLLESGCARKVDAAVLTVLERSTGILQEVKDQKPDKVDWSWVTLTPKQVVNVMVCMLYSPREFYCQILNNHDLKVLKELNVSLEEYCQKTAPSVSKIAKGEPCCAYFSGDGRWYRALMEESISDEAFKVQFVDYGNIEVVTQDKLRQISSTFLKLPFQAIRCWLSGVRPINKEWTTEAAVAFQMCTAGKKLQAKVVSLTTEGTEVELIDNSAGSPLMISEILINKCLTLIKEGSSNQNVLLADFQEAADFQEMSLYTQWTTEDIPVNKAVSVRVLEVINPGLIYVVPTEAKVDPQKLHKLMVQLADYSTSQDNHVFQPKAGEACCARFSGDDRWYRAIVLEVFVSEVKVAYADYGNMEILPLSRLIPITAPYLELPFQILKCSLAGIMELDGKWSASATERLKALLLNERVTIMVKKVSENTRAVIMNKICENNILNVADQLVIENLAKYSNSENQCAKKTSCCCTELQKQVATLEAILSFLLKDRFGEDKVPEITLLKN
ncbi:tudor domain-containing protein 1 [Sphaerodactylus townsendi]|uniref:tudor domain-containing protein 1 n=1 Tax=Sphaerodactylus townsendi TaxID=933632 RepID=UPI0020260CAC|nr:tudor domain-containing protein 1 [Sphaerodactylus townsendi]